MTSRSLIIASSICSLFAIVGCSGGTSGPAPSMVAGSVTLAGKALSDGTVSFSSPGTGNGAIAKLGAEGKFVVSGGVVPGDYRVTVTPPTPTPDNPTPPASDIPEKYRSETTSDLTCKITGGSNTLKFELMP